MRTLRDRGEKKSGRRDLGDGAQKLGTGCFFYFLVDPALMGCTLWRMQQLKITDTFGREPLLGREILQRERERESRVASDEPQWFAIAVLVGRAFIVSPTPQSNTMTKGKPWWYCIAIGFIGYIAAPRDFALSRFFVLLTTFTLLRVCAFTSPRLSQAT